MATDLTKNLNLDDATVAFVDTADQTKAMKFQLSGVSAGQTRVFTMPDADGTIATTAGSVATVSGAAQPSITSLGTLTTLTVDDITINGNTISSAGASTLAITPTAGQSITFDGTVTLDAGVIAGATSITSTTFVGNLTGDASGTSATVTGATQAAITTAANLVTVGTLTSGNADAIVSAASDVLAGKVELATTAETTTGTDATRAVTPDGLHDMTSLAGAAWFLDEDDMASDSATKTVSQQSLKAYVDAEVAGVGGNTIALTAVESGSIRDAMAISLIVNFANAGNTADFGKVTTSKKHAFSVLGNGSAMTTMKMALVKVGTPADNATFRVETDNAGEPSGSLVDANATATVSGASLTTSLVDTTITFAGSFTPTNGVKYWVVCYRSGAEDDSNYYRFGYATSMTSYVISKLTVFGASWSAAVYQNTYYSGAGFHLQGAIPNRVTTNTTQRFLGFATAAYTAGDTVIITPNGGVATGFSGLSPGFNYGGSATPGAITLLGYTAATNIIALAITDTSLRVNSVTV